MFVEKQNPKWMDVPGEEGAEFGFTPLSGGELDEAQVRAIERTLEMNISDGMSKALMKTPEQKQEDKPVTFGECNDAVLVNYGLVAWRGGVYADVPCTPEKRKLLTADVFKWAARQAFDVSVLTAGEESTSVLSGRDGGGQPPAEGARTSSPSATPPTSSLVASR